MRLSTKQIALTSVFACFYYLFSFLPGIPAPGIADLKIQVEACFATVFGYILGPFLGATSAFIGAFISWVLPPGNMSPTGLLFLPSPILNAVVSGFLFQKKYKPAIIGLSLLIISFLLTPPIQPINEYWNVGLAVVWDKIIAFLLIGAVIFLEKRSQRGEQKVNRLTQAVGKTWFAPLVSFISGLLILANNIAVAMTGKAFKVQYNDLLMTFGNKTVINAMGSLNILWIGVGLIAFSTSLLLWMKPGKQKLWAVGFLISSLVSTAAGGGFIIGLLLAVVVGIIAFFGTLPSYPTLSRVEVLRLFIMAFIGNETDNMWGSFVFALPFVYKTIYQLDDQVVRWLFLVSPFAYPAIRFLQAIIATLIATPLLRTLRSAKLIEAS